MKIKKLGHCCLVVEPKEGLRIMTDPGSYSTLQNEEKNIDVILYTHEHQDHFHLESLKNIIANNPDVKIITNASVGKLLDSENIEYIKVGDEESTEFEGILIEGFGKEHEEIYEIFGQVENTGYFIDNKLFYPGDSFYNPKKKVDILALPVAGPWMNLKRALKYAQELKPRVCFPVHDGMIEKGKPGPLYVLPPKILEPLGIEFKVLEENKEEEF